MKWRIKSGTLDCVSSGRTPSEAFTRAVRKHHPKSLGHIFSALEVGVTDEMEERYGDVVSTMEKAGLLAPEKANKS